jgi:phage terminase small subunit
MRGRKPKPAKLKVLTGSRRPIQNVPRPQQESDLTCPDFLSEVAKEEWQRVTGELTRLGLLTILDRSMLAAYCAIYDTWRAAVETLEKEGPRTRPASLPSATPQPPSPVRPQRTCSPWPSNSA